MKDYLLAASDGLKLYTIPDLKQIKPFPHNHVTGLINWELGRCGDGTFVRSQAGKIDVIDVVGDDSNWGQFRTVNKFEVQTGQCCACPKQSTTDIIAVGLADGGIQLKNYKTLKTVAIIEGRKKRTVCKISRVVDFSPDDSLVVFVREDQTIDMFDVNRKQLTYEIQHTQDEMPTMARFNSNVNMQEMCIGYANGLVKLFDPIMKVVLCKSKECHFDVCRDLCFFNQRPSSVISVGFDSSAIIHDFRMNTVPIVNFYDNPLNSVTVSADDNYVCICDNQANVTTYDIRQGAMAQLSTTNVSESGFEVYRILFMRSPLEFGKQKNAEPSRLTTNEIAPKLSSQEEIPRISDSLMLEGTYTEFEKPFKPASRRSMPHKDTTNLPSLQEKTVEFLVPPAPETRRSMPHEINIKLPSSHEIANNSLGLSETAKESTSNGSDSLVLNYDTFYNMDESKVEDSNTNCDKCAVPPATNDVPECEQQFMKNIKSRSTCLFDQRRGIKLSNEMPRTMECYDEIVDELSGCGTGDTNLSDIMAKMRRYEEQMKEMHNTIAKLKQSVAQMNQYIREFPRIVECEIEELIGKYQEEDKMLVSKMSMMCANDPLIAKLTNYVMDKQRKKWH